jgi:addiction module HigA family antidote
MPIRAVHPGEVLKEELATLGVSPTALARQIAVPANRVHQIIAGKRAVTGETALRLGHWFGTDPQFWRNLQSAYEINLATKKAGWKIARLPVRATAGPNASA